MPKNIDSLYLHFPFCSHLCNYCDFYKKIPLNKAVDYKNYHHYLEESFNIHQNLIEKNGYTWGPIKTLYIGGGTPSLWGKEGKIFLENFLNEKKIQLAEDCEFTLEVNPGAWNNDVLSAWRELGANRFSLGIQSLKKEMIHCLDRIHTLQDVYETLEYFKKEQLNFSVDFMLGLPYSEKLNRDVLKELEEVLLYGPSHISVYILTVKENYTHYASLPNEEWIEKEYLDVAAFLKEKGFLHYEVSNFALPGRHSVHNLNYWKSYSVAALGPSATGFLREERLRYKWKPNNAEMDLEILTEQEYQLEKIYMKIRSSEGVHLSEFPLEFELLTSKWELLGMASVNRGVVHLTSRGYLVIDSLMNDLFNLKLL